MSFKPATLRHQLREAESDFHDRLKSLKENAWRNNYYNEMFALLIKHGFRREWDRTPGLYQYASANGCDDIMRFVATCENLGWEFDYDSMKLSEFSNAIEVKVSKPLRIDITFHLPYDSDVCKVVEEKVVEYKEVETFKRTLVCS